MSIVRVNVMSHFVHSDQTGGTQLYDVIITLIGWINESIVTYKKDTFSIIRCFVMHTYYQVIEGGPSLFLEEGGPKI